MGALRLFLAAILFTIGLILLPLPIPFGLPLMAIALIMVLQKSKFAKRLVRYGRQRSSIFDHALAKIERNAPKIAASILRKTRPRALKKTGQKPAPTNLT